MVSAAFDLRLVARPSFDRGAIVESPRSSTTRTERHAVAAVALLT